MLIFVGHDFSTPPLKNYRTPFKKVEQSHAVKFVFGDDGHSNRQLLSAIEMQICDADLCLFDLSGRNFNVGVELGLAHGHKKPYLILLRPFQPRWFRSPINNLARFPANLEGIQRVHYKNSNTLEQKLIEIVIQYSGKADASRTINMVAAQILALLRTHHQNGLSMSEISAHIKLPMTETRAIVKRVVGEGKVTKTGRGNGTRYFAAQGLMAATG